MSGPLPSYLTIISDLPGWRFGTKVRFLGTVQSYAVETATLTLCHAFPRRHRPVRAHVDVSAALPTLGHEQTRVGEWVNVIGYVQGGRSIADHDVRSTSVNVQAVMVWSAGPMDLGAYEATVAEEIRARNDRWKKARETRRLQRRENPRGGSGGDGEGEDTDDYEFPHQGGMDDEAASARD